jgi:hypothetical protein
MDCVAAVGFERLSHRHPSLGHQYHHHGHLEGSNTGGIQFRVPIPQGLPFVLRQPMR